ncbi:hypothetical protein BST81_20245 [Leptolyngbya sp. 'hensonii']|uniref:hypothetical protein n=1 Tax=Leptolyngbya sp. 'hensonii' TaxID=1922337 RepID=UPI00094FD42B|nr:hypothetical protein [Leptolyngbya sp. 'hensonii']OLP16534.1 hypothetical protein BST81_20245 [Leptolyngbya sp. 'hensonii']
MTLALWGERKAVSTKFITYPAIAISGTLMVGLVAYLLAKPQNPPQVSFAEEALRSGEPVVEMTDPARPAVASAVDRTAMPDQGNLRISNRTDHPIRVALRQITPQSTSNPPALGKPVHWDFAPQEGSGKGLLLSLPQGGLTLKQGDILVAFAQDGSRTYWGPYVVGKTNQPLWNNQAREWQLTIEH